MFNNPNKVNERVNNETTLNIFHKLKMSQHYHNGARGSVVV
jgi:hypothetical protein